MNRRTLEYDSLEDTGLIPDDVATTAAVVYAGVAGVEIDAADPGWVAVYRAAAGMFGHDDNESENEVTIPLIQLAGQLRRAFARTHDAEGVIPEWGDLDPRFRLAWEGVTRHLSNVFGMDKQEAGRLGQHEQRMIQFMKDVAAKRAAQPRG